MEIKHIPHLWPRVALAVVTILFAAAFAQAGDRERYQYAAAIVSAAQTGTPTIEPDVFKAVPPTPIEIVVNVCNGETCLVGKGDVIENGDDWSFVQTAAHLSDGSTNPVVTIEFGSAAYDGKLIKADRTKDIAVYRIDEKLPVTAKAAIVLNDGIPAEFNESALNRSIQRMAAAAEAAQPMRIVPLSESAGPMTYAATSPVETVTITGKNCHPCHRQQKDNCEGNGDVHHSYVDQTQIADPKVKAVYAATGGTLPVTTWPDASGTMRYLVGYHTTDQIWQKIQNNNPPQFGGQSYAAGGSAGTIHAKAQIQQAISAFRQYIGENHAVEMIWDRNGSDKISLLTKDELTAKNLFGSEGRIELSAPEAVNLPIKSAAFGYRLRGRDVVCDLDPIVLSGMVDRLSPTKAVGSAPVGVIGIDDALMIYNIFQMVRDIASVLHPTCDLTLPGEVVASAILEGDTLTVTFDKAPSIRLTWLFTFNLAVKKVVVSVTNVMVYFDGSRWVKSREFSVQQ